MAIAFRYTSRQKQLKRVADRTRAQVLAIKLFKDDLRTMFASLGRLLVYTGLRLWHSLPPALVMFIPFILLLTQMARWYEYRPLVQGETAVMEMTLTEEAWQHADSLKLKPGDGIVIDGHLLDPDERIAAWRLRATGSTPTTVTWELPAQQGEKRIAVATAPAVPCAVDRQIAGSSFLDHLLNPGEPAYTADSPVQGITVYQVDPHRETPILGINIPWWLTLLIVSMATALLVRPLVGVQF